MPKGKNLFITTSIKRWEANGGCSSSQGYWGTGERPVPGHRAGWGLEHTMNTERWRKLSLVSLKKRRQIGDMTAFYSSMIRGYREDEARLLSGSYGYRMRGTGHKLEHGKFHLGTWKNQLPWGDQIPKQFFQKDRGISIFEVFKTQVDTAQSQRLSEQGTGLVDGSSGLQPQLLCDSNNSLERFSD